MPDRRGHPDHRRLDRPGHALVRSRRRPRCRCRRAAVRGGRSHVPRPTRVAPVAARGAREKTPKARTPLDGEAAFADIFAAVETEEPAEESVVARAVAGRRPPPGAEPAIEPEQPQLPDKPRGRPPRTTSPPRWAYPWWPTASPTGCPPQDPAEEQGHRRQGRSRPGRPTAGRGALQLRRRRPPGGHGQRPARDPLRAAARARHQGQPRVGAARRPRVRTGHHRDPDPGADPREASGGSGGAQHLLQHGHAGRYLRHTSGRFEPAHGVAGQGHHRGRGGLRSRPHAPPADRRYHRRRQVRMHQRDSLLDPAEGDSRRRAHDPGRSQAGRAQPL